MERRNILLFLLLLSSTAFIGNPVTAQKFGYIDSEFLLNKHPDYKVVQSELEALSTQWKKEAQQLEKEIKDMYASLQAEEVLLTEEMYQDKLNTIKEKQKEAVAFNNRVFGVNGQYYQKQAELLQPLQSKIYDAIDRVCKRNNLAMLFDKAAGPLMIYTDPRHDYSEFVLEELGLENK
ncbi:periplasmic chaperone for outer membrane proteins Skp [Aquiflexum balticum DSM 16537]|uniref:Periplasmic chaperone for outer membrane proteins Skp n=1 Tax=Aquiflexum balticum DSM 16537 TaxID=758820 RepID=A0A1W2H2F6_9BACT|nr:OmpH family outer membrane protein [Aquiflexum balticum]SMD42676.1 periplasmic chaperone for outer membrane proteins Skp [Aquiflexum balticum DSM 16537]